MGLLDSNKMQGFEPAATISVANETSTGYIGDDSIKINGQRCLLFRVVKGTSISLSVRGGLSVSGWFNLPIYNVSDYSIVGNNVTDNGVYAVDISNISVFKFYLNSSNVGAASIDYVLRFSDYFSLLTTYNLLSSSIGELNKTVHASTNINAASAGWTTITNTKSNAYIVFTVRLSLPQGEDGSNLTFKVRGDNSVDAKKNTFLPIISEDGKVIPNEIGISNLKKDNATNYYFGRFAVDISGYERVMFRNNSALSSDSAILLTYTLCNEAPAFFNIKARQNLYKKTLTLTTATTIENIQFTIPGGFKYIGVRVVSTDSGSDYKSINATISLRLNEAYIDLFSVWDEIMSMSNESRKESNWKELHGEETSAYLKIVFDEAPTAGDLLNIIVYGIR